MAELNQIFTRLQLKYDTLANWQAVKDTFVPLAGEICLAKVEVNDPANKLLQPVMAKVGDGTSTWGQLDWMSAKAADVYGWAKKATLDAADLPAIPVEKLPVDAIDTDLDTRYSITLDSDETNGDRIKIVTQLYSKGATSGDPDTKYIDIVTPAELTEVLKAYYTKNDIEDKLHTQAEIEAIAANKINALLEGVNKDDTIDNIIELVNYVNDNAADIAQLVTDVGTANTNASNAVTTANNANTTAGQALEKANEALEGAEGAAASAAAAKASEEAAKASEEAAKASENAAAGSAATAGEKASAAAASAVTAGEQAAAAAGSAQTANEQAGVAAGHASTAAGKASEAAASAAAALASEQAAGQAKADAEAAKEAAEASNTSATAIANEAKATAEAAKTASDAATEAVAGLHTIATSGSIYDVKEGANVSTGTEAGVKYLVFNCGTASTVI